LEVAWPSFRSIVVLLTDLSLQFCLDSTLLDPAASACTSGGYASITANAATISFVTSAELGVAIAVMPSDQLCTSRTVTNAAFPPASLTYNNKVNIIQGRNLGQGPGGYSWFNAGDVLAFGAVAGSSVVGPVVVSFVAGGDCGESWGCVVVALLSTCSIRSRRWSLLHRVCELQPVPNTSGASWHSRFLLPTS
jgi:hypothetical protein